MTPKDKQDYWSLSMKVAEKYSHPEDTDINESLVWALEADDETDRKIAVRELIALNDLYAASRIYWLVINGSEHARLAAVEVLAALCKDMMTLHYLVNVSLNDKSAAVRYAATEALEIFDIPRLCNS